MLPKAARSLSCISEKTLLTVCELKFPIVDIDLLTVLRNDAVAFGHIQSLTIRGMATVWRRPIPPMCHVSSGHWMHRVVRGLEHLNKLCFVNCGARNGDLSVLRAWLPKLKVESSSTWMGASDRVINTTRVLQHWNILTLAT